MTTTIGSGTATTGTLSSLGIGSGLDVNSIISGLMKVDQAPLTDLQTKATSIQSTISAYGAVQSALSTFRDAAASLSLPSTWDATTGTSSDPTSVSMTTTSGAAAGNYSVAVSALAASQSTVSGTFASSASPVGAGTLHFDLGSWNSDNTAFTAQTGNSGVDVAVTSTDTLATVATKINNASTGVTASVVNDASGSRLVFTSATTGLGNTFRVTAADSDGSNSDASGLSALAYDPASGTTATTVTQPAKNAAASVNGLSVTSETNTLTNVLSGLTINLGKTTGSSPVQVVVAQDTSGITKSVQSFVDAYNGVASLLRTDLKYDQATQIAGPLQGDSTARSLQSQLRDIVGSASGASSVFSTLSQVGLQVQTDGTLSLNSTTLTNAMANPTELKKLFTNVDLTHPKNDGIANQLRTFGDTALGFNGLLTTKVTGLQTTLQNNGNDQATMNTQLAATQARLQAQYSALDTQMGSINALSTYVTQQITNWNKSTA